MARTQTATKVGFVGLCAALTMGTATARADALSVKERAEKEAKKLRDQAAKARAALPAAQRAREAARARYDAARPKLEAEQEACLALAELKKKRLDESLAACDEQASRARDAAEARAAPSHDALVAPFQQALEACEQQADLSRATCEDDCSSSAIRCREANGDRTNAQKACDGTEEKCKRPCAESAVGACQTAFAQLEKASSSGRVTAPQADLCRSLRREAEALGSERSKGLKAAAAPLEKAHAEVARLERAAQGDAQADRLVAGATRCGALGRAFFPSAKLTLGGILYDIDSFCMDRTEVTTSAYAACVASGNCTRSIYDGRCNAGVPGREDHPINCVDLNEAAAYCAAQGQRLPTGEEWGYAATGGDGRTYPWGNAEPKAQLCWNGEGNSLGKGNRRSTCPVGSYPRGDSPFGISDLSGNVWEWTSPFHAFSNRIDRGGGWRDVVPSYVRSAGRYRYDPFPEHDNVGFRCAGSPLP